MQMKRSERLERICEGRTSGPRAWHSNCAPPAGYPGSDPAIRTQSGRSEPVENASEALSPGNKVFVSTGGTAQRRRQELRRDAHHRQRPGMPADRLKALFSDAGTDMVAATKASACPS